MAQEDIDPVEVAHELTQHRINLVATHAKQVEAERKARELLEEEEKKTAQTWAELLKAGWTERELAQHMKFQPPGKRPPGRPRGKSKPKTRATSSESSSTSTAGASTEGAATTGANHSLPGQQNAEQQHTGSASASA